MRLRVFAVFFLGFCSFECSFGFSRERTKRQDVSVEDQNMAIEFYGNCSCVRFYQCDEDNFIITNGKDLIDDRTGSKKARIKCEGGKYEGEKVCCKHRAGEETKGPATLVLVEPSEKTTKVPTIGMKKVCGQQLPTISVRIFNDEEEDGAPINGEFPWMVSIFIKDPYSGEWNFQASGALIHPRVILTANHVVLSAKANGLKVIANGRVLLSRIGENPLQERNIKEIINHEEYQSGGSRKSAYNDIALLILEESYNITHTPYINTLCLRPDISFENKRCFVAGWGKAPTSENQNKVLKKVQLPTLQHSKCEELLRAALRRTSFTFHESFMCAGGEPDKDTCKGDGGSPLVCPIEDSNRMYQVGIVSWGVGCGKKDVPGAYTNVVFLHDWIVSHLGEREIYLSSN